MWDTISDNGCPRLPKAHHHLAVGGGEGLLLPARWHHAPPPLKQFVNQSKSVSLLLPDFHLYFSVPFTFEPSHQNTPVMKSHHSVYFQFAGTCLLPYSSECATFGSNSAVWQLSRREYLFLFIFFKTTKQVHVPWKQGEISIPSDAISSV